MTFVGLLPREPSKRAETGSISTAGQRASGLEIQEALKALCVARNEMADDPLGARSTFYDRSHETLHVIAGAVGRVDRPEAARLLEAMQRVEADLRARQASAQEAKDFATLIAATRSSLTKLSIKGQGCSS